MSGTFIWFFRAKNEWRIGSIYIFVGVHVLICSKAKLTSVQKGWFLAENMIWWNNISSMPIFGEGGDKIFKKPGLVLFASKLQPFRCSGPFLSPTNTSQSNCWLLSILWVAWKLDNNYCLFWSKLIFVLRKSKDHNSYLIPIVKLFYKCYLENHSACHNTGIERFATKGETREIKREMLRQRWSGEDTPT